MLGHVPCRKLLRAVSFVKMVVDVLMGVLDSCGNRYVLFPTPI